MTTFLAQQPVKLLALETAFPKTPVSTNDLIESLSTHCRDNTVARRARAIAHRLGIKRRYLSRDLSSASGRVHENCDAPSLCLQALKRSVSKANYDIDDVQYLIGHTTSPHTLLPPNIAWVADRIDFKAPYMELRQACTGFANALQVASAMLSANAMRCVGIVGSEVGSPFFSATDDFTNTAQLVNYVQMGDGAAVALLGPVENETGSVLSDLFIGHIGNSKTPGLSLNGGGSAAPYCEAGFPSFEHHPERVRENGSELFSRGLEAVYERGYRLDDFRYIIPHQANGRIQQLLADHLGIERERVYSTAHKYGNLGSAAIWAALAALRQSDDLERGDKVLILGAEATKYLYGGFVYTH